MTRKLQPGPAQDALHRWESIWLQKRRRRRAAAHAGPTVPTAPGNLSVADESTDVRVAWQDRSSDETGFRLYRQVDGGAFGLYQTLGANVTSYQDANVIQEHFYYYYVTAYNAAGESAPSNTAGLQFGAA